MPLAARRMPRGVRLRARAHALPPLAMVAGAECGGAFAAHDLYGVRRAARRRLRVAPRDPAEAEELAAAQRQPAHRLVGAGQPPVHLTRGQPLTFGVAPLVGRGDAGSYRGHAELTGNAEDMHQPVPPPAGRYACAYASLDARRADCLISAAKGLGRNHVGNVRARRLGPSSRTWPSATRSRNGAMPMSHRYICPVSASTARSTSRPWSSLHTVMPVASMLSQPSAPPTPVSTRWTTVRVVGSLSRFAAWCIRQMSESPSQSSSVGSVNINSAARWPMSHTMVESASPAVVSW